MVGFNVTVYSYIAYFIFLVPPLVVPLIKFPWHKSLHATSRKKVVLLVM